MVRIENCIVLYIINFGLLCFKDGVKTQVVSIRNILSYHHKLMSDIRSILKSLAKVTNLMDITL